MAEIYEFHVAGLIGPVVRSALPELATGPDSIRDSVLSGTADRPGRGRPGVETLGDAGLTATAHRHQPTTSAGVAEPARRSDRTAQAAPCQS